MNTKCVSGWVGGLLVGLFAFGCQTAAPSGDAPDVADDTLDGKDYDVWANDFYMEPYAVSVEGHDEFTDMYSQWNEFHWGFRLYNYSSNPSATRGGGACLVQRLGNSCDLDTDCLPNGVTTQDPDNWVYCAPDASQYAAYFNPSATKVCWRRPGSQAELCTLGPNRTAGDYVGGSEYSCPPSQLNSTFAYRTNGANVYVLGCLTKAAGPNTACGGQNSSLYVRAVIESETQYRGP